MNPLIVIIFLNLFAAGFCYYNVCNARKLGGKLARRLVWFKVMLIIFNLVLAILNLVRVLNHV